MNNPSIPAQALYIKDVSAGYGKSLILDRLSLPGLAPGSVVALVGPNGAGKSTLLRAVAGLIKATGVLQYGAHDLMKMPLRSKARYISFMPQMVPHDVNLSVIDAVISALKASPFDMLGRENEGVYCLAMEALERVGIRDLALHNLGNLSGGQRQLASLARSVVRGPAVLLLDEPTSALDLKHQVRVMKLLRTFACDGRIVIVVLHDLNMALRWCDQIIVLKDGKLKASGAPRSAITPQVVQDVYGVQVRIESCSKGFLQVIAD